MEEIYNILNNKTIAEMQEKINSDYNNEVYLLYLRKSREDIEYERENKEFKTLERHQKRLIAIANSMGITINNDYILQEVVSGDSISERPIIQDVLKIIENPKIKGLLVIDVQRLTRGDLGDQDRIIKTFKYTNTIIITPEKEYNLQHASDEEYLIDKLAYSRKEYLGIKKRLNEGRKDSVSEGKFVGSRSAFGYERYKLKGQKGWSLKIIDEQAEIVRLIFKMFLEGKGTFAISSELNKSGVKSPEGSIWRKNGIREMLHNQTYIGKVKWQERKQIKVMEDSKIKTKTIRQKLGKYQLVEGLHDAIINEEDFNKAQEMLKNSSSKYVPEDKSLKNPLAGIVRCSVCGKVLSRRDGSKQAYYSPRGSKINPKYYYSKPFVSCTTGAICGIKSNNLEDVEELLIETLKFWVTRKKVILKDYSKNSNTVLNNIHNQIQIINNEIIKEEKKLNKLRDFLEDGIYDKKTYIERSCIVEEQLRILKEKKIIVDESNEHNKMAKLKESIPIIEKGLNNYYKLDVKERNDFLHEFIEKAIYTKTKEKKQNDLTLDLYMKM